LNKKTKGKLIISDKHAIDTASIVLLNCEGGNLDIGLDWVPDYDIRG
jgi:hypothetical protein